MITLKKEDLARIGRIRKVSGYKGELLCYLEEVKPEAVKKKKFFFILIEGLPVPFEIDNLELNGTEMIVQFFDVDSEEQAKKLVQKDLFTEKGKNKTQKGITDWKDLEGFHVTDQSLGELGKITDVFEYPMQMIARCEVKGKEVLFPLNEEIVVEIDEKEKALTVDLPPGLLDVYLY